MSKKEFHQIFKKYYQTLCRFAYIIAKSKEIADEVVQQTFISFWENRNFINIHKDLKSYLYTMVKNGTYNYLKSNKIRKDYENEYVSFTVNNEKTEIDDQLFKEKLKWAIEQLPEKCRIVYCLKYMEGLTYDEIANYLDISSNTVDNHIQKALKMLRENLYRFKGEFYNN